MTNIKEFEGKIVEKIEIIKENQELDEQIIFSFKDGSKYKMYHDQDCCEDVKIVDIKGDINKLIGKKIIKAEEKTSKENPPLKEFLDDSFTWVFYDIETLEDHIQIKWYGESNGYYSEEVCIEKID